MSQRINTANVSTVIRQTINVLRNKLLKEKIKNIENTDDDESQLKCKALVSLLNVLRGKPIVKV